MTKRTRRSLFYALCALFLIGGSGVILYAQGWRIDFSAFTIKKVGAIYVRSFPQSAAITLNGKPMQNKSGLLDHGTFISSLFPKNYLLELSAEGYQDWKQHVAVEPSVVSELKYAVLIPTSAEKAAGSAAADFQVVNNELLTVSASGKLSWKGMYLPGTRAAAWTDDSNYIVTEDERTGAFFLNDFSKPIVSSTAQSVSKNFGFKPTEIIRDPAAGNLFLVQNASSVFSFDPAKDKTLSNSLAPATGVFAASPSRLAWTRFNLQGKTSRIIFYDRFSKNSVEGIKLPGRTEKLEFRTDDELAILQDDGELYSLRAGAADATKTADRVKDFFVSQEQHLVAALEPESIEIFSFDADKNYWRFRLPDNASIRRLEWYADEAHLFVFYPDAVKFLDLNDKALENFSEAVSAKIADYDPKSNDFYFLKDGSVWKSEFPR